MLDTTTIGLVAVGKMGEAILAGVIRDGVQSRNIAVSNHRPLRVEELAGTYRVHATRDNAAAVRNRDVVVICCKPQVFDAIAVDIADTIRDDALIVSVMAGVPVDRLRSALQHDRVVRAMPNLPATIGRGVSVWLATPETDESQAGTAAALLASLGIEVRVHEEGFLDMATALSGTGPAYAFLLMEGLIDVGVQMGFPRHLAGTIVQQTLLGAVEYAIRSGLHPVDLRNAVTSPAGTTAHALYELERGGLRTVLADGVLAAYRRSVELGRLHHPGDDAPGRA